MDEFDESLEMEPENGRGNKLGVIAIWIGVVGIVVGITGIFLANQAQTKVRAVQAQLAATPDMGTELKASYEDLDTRLVRLGSEFVKLGRQDRQLQENTQAAFDAVTKDVRTNRDGLNLLTEKLGELYGTVKPSRVVHTPPVTVEPKPVSSTTENTVSALIEPGFYVIQSGDTLSKVAKAYGVSLTRLQEANPTIDARTLQIGQKIIIPAP